MRQVVRRSNEQWFEIFNLWESSNKKLKDWCKEESIPYNSFLTARRRLIPQKKLSISKASFLEIKEKPLEISETELQLRYKSVTLLLYPNFEEKTLIRFLKTLEKLDASTCK